MTLNATTLDCQINRGTSYQFFGNFRQFLKFRIEIKSTADGHDFLDPRITIDPVIFSPFPPTPLSYFWKFFALVRKKN